MKIKWNLVATVMLLSVGSLAAEQPAEFYQLKCEPIEVVVPPGFGSSMQGPNLSVVNTKIKPKHTRLLLDGRAIGRASDFDGKPGPLFLRPGRYRIVAELGGYTSTVFEVDPRAQCFFQIKHKMNRIPGTDKEPRGGHPELVGLTDDIYGPLVPAMPGAQPAQQSETRPILTLRPDLPPGPSGTIDRDTGGGCLSFDVDPDFSAVYLNGAFVASVAELQQMENPLAVTSGEHLIEIVAPGYEAAEKRITVTSGEKLSVNMNLKKVPTGQRH